MEDEGASSPRASAISSAVLTNGGTSALRLGRLGHPAFDPEGLRTKVRMAFAIPNSRHPRRPRWLMLNLRAFVQLGSYYF